MATWAVGDIHGCFATLERLLDRLELSAEDRLWLTGDLVNRGPHSLAVLRWARDQATILGSRFVSVLGNHDLHFVAVSRGLSTRRKKDSLGELLAAPDRAELTAWLESRSLLHHEGRWLLVHAGLLPEWTVSEAVSWARRVENGLAEQDRAAELLRRAGHEADTGDPEWRALAAFTRMRTLTDDGSFGAFTGTRDELPRGERPWFSLESRRSSEVTIVAGHWAALGLHLGDRVIALDTGAAWGGPLTAIRLEDRYVVQEPNRDVR